MLKLWLPSVRRRGKDPPDRFLTLLHLELLASLHGYAVLTHQPADTALSVIACNHLSAMGGRHRDQVLSVPRSCVGDHGCRETGRTARGCEPGQPYPCSGSDSWADSAMPDIHAG